MDLYDNRARAYSPTLMRFLQNDPIGFMAGDADFYRYEGDDPTGFLDPSGLEKFNPRNWYTQEEAQAILDAWAAEKAVGQKPGFKLCARWIQADNICEACATIGGGQHAYIQLGPVNGSGEAVGTVNGFNPAGGDQGLFDANGNHTGPTVGLGFYTGGIVHEHAFHPNKCKECRKTDSVLKHGMGAGKKGTQATDQEIWDCLKNATPTQSYDWQNYNCLTWAVQAADSCGLDCGEHYNPAPPKPPEPPMPRAWRK